MIAVWLHSLLKRAIMVGHMCLFAWQFANSKFCRSMWYRLRRVQAVVNLINKQRVTPSQEGSVDRTIPCAWPFHLEVNMWAPKHRQPHNAWFIRRYIRYHCTFWFQKTTIEKEIFENDRLAAIISNSCEQSQEKRWQNFLKCSVI